MILLYYEAINFSWVVFQTKYFCILMLAPFSQKKQQIFHIEVELFFIIDNCRYGTKLALNFNKDLVPIKN